MKRATTSSPSPDDSVKITGASTPYTYRLLDERGDFTARWHSKTGPELQAHSAGREAMTFNVAVRRDPWTLIASESRDMSDTQRMARHGFHSQHAITNKSEEKTDGKPQDNCEYD